MQHSTTMAPITRSLSTRKLRSHKSFQLHVPIHHTVQKPANRKVCVHIIKAKLDKATMKTSMKKLKASIANSSYKMHDIEDPMLHLIIKSELKRRNLGITYEQLLEFDALKRNISQQLGGFWQELLSNAQGYQNLKTGHASGCDLINHKRKHIIELKNKYNTMNSSSYHGVNMKMIGFMAEHPGYTGIIGIMNDKTREGRDIVNRYGIRELGGQRLIEFLFEDEDITPTMDDLVKMYLQL